MLQILPARTPRVPAAARTSARALAALASLAALLVAAPALRAQTFRDDRGQTERREVREVRVQGTDALDRDDVEEALATKASGCLSLLFRPFCLFTKSPAVYQRRYFEQAEFERDVVRLLVFYYKRGYRDAKVDTSVTRAGRGAGSRGAVRVTFRVTEGPPTRTREVAVDDPTGTFGAREAQRLLTPRPGEPFNTLRLDSALVRVRSFYSDRGYGNAAVSFPLIAIDEAADTATVRILVNRGPLTPISRIDIVRQGDQREVKEQTIRNALSVEPGKPYSQREVGRSQRALYETGLFRSALIDTAVATQGATGETVCLQQGTPAGRAAARAAAVAAGPRADSSKALVVCVAEAPLREARTSVGLSTADFAQVEGRFTHNYFLGGARRLNVQATVGNLGARGLSQALPSAVFNNPYANDVNIPGAREDRFFLPTYFVGADLQQRDVGSPRNTLGFGLFASRRLSPGVFVDQGQGANASFTRRFGQRAPVSIAYRFELNRVQAGDVYFCVNFGVCDRNTIAAVSSAKRLAPVVLTAQLGRADDPLSPTRGAIGRFTVEHASALTLSQFRYNRATGEVSYYRPAPGFPRVTLATHLRGGFVRALGNTVSAAGVGGTDFQLLHPRTRFYAGGAQSVRGYGENQLGPRVLTVSPDQILGRRDTTIAGQRVALYACGGPGADSTVLRQCFAQRRDAIGDGSFNPRPLGGSALLEGSVEARFPVWQQLFGAVFLDGGLLGERSFRDLASGTRALTPGFGVRYRSPVGPVRVDLGIRPRIKETLGVITQLTDSTRTNTLLDLRGSDANCESATQTGCRLFPNDPQGGFRGVLRRLVLHLSIGEAF